MSRTSAFVRGRPLLVVTLCLASVMTASGQTAAVPTYDVVSIKPHKNGADGWRINIHDGVYMATNVPLMMLIESAYDLKTNDELSGLPGWANSAAFDIEAKMDPDAAAELKKSSNEVKKERQLAMMQALLADRFQLKIHHETKVLTKFALVVAKSGVKMKQADPNDTYPNGPKGPDGASHAGMMMMSNGKLTAQAVPIESLVRTLARQLHGGVDDKTGLTGKYDFTLKWTPDDMPAESKETTGADSGPSLFTALQEQLGLKLDSVKGPVDTIVVDHIELPSAN